MALVFCLALAQPLQAQDLTGLALSGNSRDIPGFNLNGAPGLIEMPSAAMAPDATLSGSLSRIGGITRSTITFQITPRLSGSFRYAALDGLTRLGGNPCPALTVRPITTAASICATRSCAKGAIVRPSPSACRISPAPRFTGPNISWPAKA
ncbi:YjbH domain-containing protein [Seohaeicola saemankumensis]|uniref:YjbH domain-containing protein n=1 Tax=Seohaeicola saemankumensis TaxID=481181 RepID=UPI0035CF2E77